MFRKLVLALAASATLGAAALAPTSASAWHHHHRHGWGWGAAAFGAGLATSAIISSAYAAPSGCCAGEALGRHPLRPKAPPLHGLQLASLLPRSSPVGPGFPRKPGPSFVNRSLTINPARIAELQPLSRGGTGSA